MRNDPHGFRRENNADQYSHGSSAHAYYSGWSRDIGKKRARCRLMLVVTAHTPEYIRFEHNLIKNLFKTTGQ